MIQFFEVLSYSEAHVVEPVYQHRGCASNHDVGRNTSACELESTLSGSLPTIRHWLVDCRITWRKHQAHAAVFIKCDQICGGPFVYLTGSFKSFVQMRRRRSRSGLIGWTPSSCTSSPPTFTAPRARRCRRLTTSPSVATSTLSSGAQGRTLCV